MKNIITAVALTLATTITAQTKPTETWGRDLEQAGNKRQAALLIGLGGALVAGAIYASDSEQIQPAIGMGAICLGTSFVLNFGAARKERRAGIKAQGR